MNNSINSEIDVFPSDWSDVAVFLAVFEAGSLMAAAEQLELSQPTVGRRLAAFEKRMGVSLFARVGRRLAPTELAYRIEDSARKMSREMLSIKRLADGSVSGLHGQVTVSANEGTGSEWLVPVLAELQQVYPDISIDLRIESRTVDLVQREADIALRMGRPTQLDLITRKLASVGFGFYASEAWLERNEPINVMADLNGRRWVWGVFGPNRTDLLGDYLRERNVESELALRTDSPAAQLRAVQEGMGLAVLSHRWASKHPDLRRVLPDVAAATYDLWLVTHEDLRHSARIRAVADHIAAAAQRDAALFEHGSQSTEKEAPGK
ncbi:MAG: LysR family transcriptional regulator [Pseudomonadota bacterium]